MVVVNIKLLDKSLPLPRYSHKGDAGLDLYSSIDCILKPFERKLIPTGIKIAIPEGYAGFVQPRSGLAIKNGISIVNSPGLIDSGYRGEVCVVLINLDKEKDFHINKGDRICQMVVKKIEIVDILKVDKLSKTDRNSNGFGSTDK